MNIIRRFRLLPLFWQVYLFIVTALIVVVALTELVLEPLAEMVVLGVTDFDVDWYEVPVWAFSIFIPSLACGLFIARTLTGRLEAMARAARALSRGNLGIRLKENGNERDAFDVLAGSFNQMADAIERQLRNERRLLADISHELRAPLSRMAIAVELLDRKGDDGTSPAAVARLQKEVDHMGGLVALLLAQGRERVIRAGEMDRLDLAPVLEAILKDCRFQGRQQNKTLDAAVERELFVQGSVAMLQSILENVLGNALFYAPPGSAVRVTARRAGDAVEVVVRDMGPGVPEDQLQDIFRAFYRVDGSRTRSSGGVGLGLALAKDAAVHLGGGIWARNAGPGLEVTVSLPFHANGGA